MTTVGPSSWPKLARAGWRWLENLPPCGKTDRRTGMFYSDHETRYANDRLDRIQQTHGADNVLTGNAWDDGRPTGLPGKIGVYVKDA